MKKTLIIGIGLLFALALCVIFGARQCFYEIGNGFFAGEALIPTALVLISFVFFTRARVATSVKNALQFFILGSGAITLMLLFINNTDPVSLFNPDESQYTCAIQEYTFPEYYLKGKTLYTNTDFSTGLPIAVNKTEKDFAVPEEQCEAYLQSLEKWKQEDWEGNVTNWIVTEDWENDIAIYCFDLGGKKYMCPQSVYKRCIDPADDLAVDSYESEERDEEDNLFPETILRHYNNTSKLLARECFVILTYFTFGLLLSISILPMGKTLLAALLALPVGCGVFALIGYISLILHLPYNWVTFAVIAIGILMLFLLTDKQSLSRIRGANIYICFAGLFVIALISFVIIYRSAYLPGGDTYSCALIGMNIANDPQFFFESIDWVASYGLFYSILNSQSYLIGGDYLFAINVLMGITGILLLTYFSYTLVRRYLKKYNVIAEGLIALVVCTLFFSADYHIHIFYFLANMTVSVWFLISFGLIIVGHESSEFKEYWKIVSICFVMIIHSRVEGGIYIGFFLTCLLVDYLDDKYCLRLVVISLIWSVQLNIVQLIYNGNVGSTLFWNPKRGMILMAALAMPVILNVIRRSHLPVVSYVFEQYYDFLIIFIIAGTIVLSYLKRGLAAQNIVYFTIHIIENKYFWMMIFAFVPIIMLYKENRGIGMSFSMTVILGYLFMLFSLFLFRNSGENGMDEPLRVGMWDSGRRTLFQIMPTAAFLILYELVNWLKEKEQLCVTHLDRDM